MVEKNSVNIQNSNNNIELYIINSWNAWYVNYVSISLFFFKSSIVT